MSHDADDIEQYYAGRARNLHDRRREGPIWAGINSLPKSDYNKEYLTSLSVLCRAILH